MKPTVPPWLLILKGILVFAGSFLTVLATSPGNYLGSFASACGAELAFLNTSVASALGEKAQPVTVENTPDSPVKVEEVKS